MSSSDAVAFVDDNALNQLLEIDDDENHEFTRGILQEFFEQLDAKLPECESLLANGDYDQLAKLGHYLKGSSAGVGAAEIRKLCDDIQHYENLAGDDPTAFLTERVRQLREAVEPTRRELSQRVGGL